MAILLVEPFVEPDNPENILTAPMRAGAVGWETAFRVSPTYDAQ